MDRIIISFDINDKDELPSFKRKEPPQPIKPEQSEQVKPDKIEQVKTAHELHVIHYKLNKAEKMREYAKEYYKNYAKEYYKNYAKVYYQKKKLNKLLEKEKEEKQNKELVTKLGE